MKRLLATATLLTVIATPAFAQAFDPDVGTGNIVPPLVVDQGGGSAYAQAPGNSEIGYAQQKQTVRRMHPTTYGSEYNSKTARKHKVND